MPLDLDAFKSTQIYSTKASAETIVADIDKIRQLDKETEASLTQWLIVIIAGVVVTIGCVVALIMTEFSLTLFLAPLAVIGLGAAIFGGIMRWQIGHLDFEDRRYELIERLVTMLGRDMPKGDSFDLQLDLRTPEHAEKYVNEGYQGPWQVKYYVDSWLKLRGRFLDGTSFTLVAIEKFQARGKWGGRRGNKWKTKNRSATDMILTLKPKGEKYAMLSAVTGDMYGALRLPPWTQLKMLNEEEGGICLRVGAKTEWEVPPANGQPPAIGFSGVDMVASMFLSVYQVLNLVKAMQKAQGGGKA